MACHYLTGALYLYHVSVLTHIFVLILFKFYISEYSCEPEGNSRVDAENSLLLESNIIKSKKDKPIESKVESVETEEDDRERGVVDRIFGLNQSFQEKEESKDSDSESDGCGEPFEEKHDIKNLVVLDDFQVQPGTSGISKNKLGNNTLEDKQKVIDFT